MIDLREYKDLIKECVSTENAEDENWKWSVKSIGKTVVHIRWGYLDYLEEKETFSITSETYGDLDDTIIWRHPHGDMISFASIGNRPGDNAANVTEAIKMAIKGIAGYAHSRY